MKEEKIKKINTFLLVVIGLLAIALIITIINRSKDYHFTEEINGKKLEVSFRIGALKKPDKIEKEIKEKIKTYQELFDTEKTNKKNNNLYYINHELALNKSLKIDSDLYRLLAYGKDDVYKQSDGKINIAAGYLNKAVYENQKVSLDNINSNIEAIVLDENKQTITKTEDILIDLTEVVDGFIVEEISFYFDNVPVNNYTLKMDKINRVGGASIKDKAHKIDIYKVGSKEKLTTLKLNYFACATTDKESAFVNAKTKQIDNNFASVTVVALMSSTAEYYANELFTMDIETGLEYINEIARVEAIWYGNDGKVYRSDNFKDYE